MEARIDSGIEVMTISVLRQEPRNSRIMSAVRQPAIAPSWTTPVTAARTKTLWSNKKSTLRLDGRPARIVGISLRTCVHDRKGRGAAVAQDRQQGRVAPISPHQICLGLEAVVDEGDIADINHGPV